MQIRVVATFRMKRILLTTVLLVLTVGCTKIDNLFQGRERQVNPKLVAIPSKNPLEVKVAMFLPLSGKYQYLGQSIIDAVQLALYELRADDITFQAIDVGSDHLSAKEAMRDIDFKDIDIILGPVFKEQVKVVHKYARQENLIMITYSNDLDLINKSGIYIFDIVPYQQIKKVVAYASNNKYSNLYSVAPENKYGDLIKKILLNNKGEDHYNIKKIALYTPADAPIFQKFALSDAILDIKSSMKGDIANTLPGFGHPVILLPESGHRLLSVVNQLQFLHSASDPKYKVLGIGDWNEYVFQQNLIAQNAWIADIPHELLYEFDGRFIDNYKYKAPRIAAVAYDSILLIAAILNNSNGKIIIQFQEIERSNGYQGITGTFRLKSNGITERLYSVYQYQKGKMEEILPAMKGF